MSLDHITRRYRVLLNPEHLILREARFDRFHMAPEEQWRACLAVTALAPVRVARRSLWEAERAAADIGGALVPGPAIGVYKLFNRIPVAVWRTLIGQ